MLFKKRAEKKDENGEAAATAPEPNSKAEEKAAKKAEKLAAKAAKTVAKAEKKAAKQAEKLAAKAEKQAAKDAKGISPDKPDIKDKSKKAEKIKTGKAGSVKPKPNKFLRGARFVLFIGDEGTILLYMKNNVVISRQFVPDSSEQNLEELRASFELDVKAPLSIVIDNLDQTYVQQSLPPVSAMSVKKLIKRRLERDFGANDITGAVLLGRDKAGRKDWNFLMVSIEKSRQVAAWLDFVYNLPQRFAGIYLVSIETEIIIKSLEQAMGVPKDGTGSKWKFFVSHNKVGGFRQVILRDGRIIFTRMAQPIGESTPEVIAGNIEQEMQGTMEYMKRLSFDPESGLDVYIIAGGAVKPVIDKTKFRVSSFNIMTPFEVAKYLGIEGATQPSDQFGDVILAACISSSPKHVLTFKTPESEKFDNLYNIFRFQRLAGVLAVLGILGYAGSIGSDIYNAYQLADELADNHRKRQVSLDNLKADIKRNDLDVYKTGDTIELYQFLQQQQVSPLEFISKIELVITYPIVIKNIDWKIDDKSPLGSAQAKPKISVILTLSFPEVKTLEYWKVVSKKLVADIKTAFKGYDATFGKLPSQFMEVGEMNISFDNPTPKPVVVDDNSDVILTIKQP